MTFRSLYRHGFARVAACTMRCSHRRPRRQCRSRPARRQDCDERSAAWRSSRNWRCPATRSTTCCCRTPLLDAVERALEHASRRLGEAAAAAAGGRAAAPCQRRDLQLRAGHPPRPAAGRGAEDPSAELPRVLREAAFRLGRRHRGRRDPDRRRRPAPFGPDLLFAAEDVPGFVVHAEICEDFWVPIPPSCEAALAGATVLANLSASNITIGKAETRRLLCQSQSGPLHRGLSLFRRRGRRIRPPTSPGTARPRSSRTARCWPRPTASRQATRSRVADVDLDLLRQERMRMGTLRRQPPLHAAILGRLPPRRVQARSADERYRAASGGSSASPSCPPTRRGWRRTATRPTTSRSPGLAQRLRATGIERAVIGVSGGLDFDPCADRRRQGDGPARACRAPTSSPIRCRASRPATTPRATPSG